MITRTERRRIEGAGKTERGHCWFYACWRPATVTVRAVWESDDARHTEPFETKVCTGHAPEFAERNADGSIAYQLPRSALPSRVGAGRERW